MATVDLTVGGTSGAPAHNSGRLFTDFRELNFATTNRSSGDILQLFDIPAGAFVQFVAYQVVTAEGGTLTFDIGDTAVDADGFIDGANGNSTGYGCSAPFTLAEATPNTIVGYGNGKLFTSTDTIDMLLNNDADAAVIRVWCVWLDFNP